MPPREQARTGRPTARDCMHGRLSCQVCDWWRGHPRVWWELGCPDVPAEPPVAEPAQPVCKGFEPTQVGAFAIHSACEHCGKLQPEHVRAMCGPGSGNVTGRQKTPQYCSEACCDAGRPLNPPPAVPPGPVPAEGQLSERIRHGERAKAEFDGWGDEVAALETKLSETREELEAHANQEAAWKLLLDERNERIATAERDAAAETAGKLSLRARFGALDHETWAMFIERLVSERDEARGRADVLATRVLDPTEYGGPSTGVDLVDRLRGIYISALGGERRFGSSAINREAAVEIKQLQDRLDEKAASARTHEGMWKAAKREVAAARRQGWRDGAEATRKADAQSISSGLADSWAAARLRALPLPVCPDEPPAGTPLAFPEKFAAFVTENVERTTRAREMRHELAKLDQADSDGAQADAINAAVASERERCLWWARARIELGVLPSAALIDDIADGHAIPSGAPAPGMGK